MKSQKTEARNIVFHVLDGAFFMGGMVFLDQFTIMTAYIRQITPNPLIISLIPAAVVLGFNVPGLFTAPLIQKIKNKHRFIAIAGIFQRLMVLLLGLFTLSLGKFSPMASGLISALIYFMFSGIGGIGGPAWLDLVARTISTKKRSRVIALRNSLGAGAGIVFPVLIAYILKNVAFPGNYRILFFMAFGFVVLSLVSFVFIKDEAPPEVHKTSNHRFLPFLKELPKNDPNFLRFLISRIIFSFSIIGNSFYTLYYLSTHQGINDSIVASFALAMNISKIVSGLLMGLIGDHKGNLLVYKIAIAAVIPSSLLALFYPSMPVFLGVYVLLGLCMSADINTYQSFIGEFGHDHNRVFYAALGSSMAGIFAGLLPILAGALLKIGWVGYNGLFLFCILLAVISLIFVHFGVKDPRDIAVEALGK